MWINNWPLVLYPPPPPKWPWYILGSWFPWTQFFLLSPFNPFPGPFFLPLLFSFLSVCLGVLSLIRAFAPSWRPTPLNSSMSALHLHFLLAATGNSGAALHSFYRFIPLMLTRPLLLLPRLWLCLPGTLLAFISTSPCKCEENLKFCSLRWSWVSVFRCVEWNTWTDSRAELVVKHRLLAEHRLSHCRAADWFPPAGGALLASLRPNLFTGWRVSVSWQLKLSEKQPSYLSSQPCGHPVCPLVPDTKRLYYKHELCVFGALYLGDVCGSSVCHSKPWNKLMAWCAEMMWEVDWVANAVESWANQFIIWPWSVKAIWRQKAQRPGWCSGWWPMLLLNACSKQIGTRLLI